MLSCYAKPKKRMYRIWLQGSLNVVFLFFYDQIDLPYPEGNNNKKILRLNFVLKRLLCNSVKNRF